MTSSDCVLSIRLSQIARCVARGSDSEYKVYAVICTQLLDLQLQLKFSLEKKDGKTSLIAKHFLTPVEISAQAEIIHVVDLLTLYNLRICDKSVVNQTRKAKSCYMSYELFMHEIANLMIYRLRILTERKIIRQKRKDEAVINTLQEKPHFGAEWNTYSLIHVHDYRYNAKRIACLAFCSWPRLISYYNAALSNFYQHSIPSFGELSYGLEVKKNCITELQERKMRLLLLLQTFLVANVLARHYHITRRITHMRRRLTHTRRRVTSQRSDLTENQKNIKSILTREPKVHFSKTTKYKVCKREYSNQEYSKVAQLKKAMDKDVGTYVKNKQVCNANRKTKKMIATYKRDLASVQTQFASISGVQVTELYCIAKGDVESGTLSMCNECAYRVTLPESFYPRFHYHFTCDNSDNYSCFYGEGTCMENVVTSTVKHDEQEVGWSYFSDWKDYPIDFTSSCSCQIIEGSLFSSFVTD
ncbi:uncharacterized protein LOC130645957 [Hydractinia symbiolongicarpus]|uniref:uncharacterized protein LOC130645957 n=1 Tax=Hydractinia symbiolongicarpus TaxID=13093 RepID=UPI00254EEA51|nr:uncharacterized protein LOC130645957 [Hydractinia symbiolongicarpus]